MAVSQSFSISQVSQSIEGNYSTVRIYWTSTQSGQSRNLNWRTAYYYVYVNGSSSYTTYSADYNLPQYDTRIVVDTTIRVPHRNDGTGSVYVYAWMDTGISAGEVTHSDSLTLSTIPRATTPTFSASSIDMGKAVTITLNRASSSFTHELSYSFGTLSNQTSGLSASSSVGTSATFTPPLALADQIPNSTSGTCTITCKTYSGSTLIGTKTATLTLTVPSTVVPTISAVSISEATSGLAAKFGAFVQNKSTLAVAITASGSYSSTIAKYETYIQSVLYREASFTSNVITASGTIGVLTTVTDSRGRTAQISKSITIVAYSAPKISYVNAWRITSDGVASDNGNRLAMWMKFEISSVGGKNDRTYNFKYCKSTDITFTSFASGTASTSYNGTQYFKSSPEISTDYAYVIRIEIADYFQTVTYDAQIPTGFTIMDFRSTGKGMAIGKVSEKNAFEVAMASEFSGQMKIFTEASDVADSGFIRMYRNDKTVCAFLATSDGGNGLNLHFYDENGVWSGVVKFTSDGAIIAKNLAYGTAIMG